MDGRRATRWKLAAILVAVLLASCGGRPGVAVSVAGATVPMVVSSVTQRTACSSSHGDAFPQDPPLTIVRAPMPVKLNFEAGQGATSIRGWIYDVDAPTPSGGPQEEFLVPGRTGAHTARSIVPGRTYQVLVNVPWSFFVTGGEETHVFRLRVEPPGP
jgi:hypothetical protein